MHRFISAIRRRRRGAWRDRRGAVAVEFAFLFPIALVFTFGLIEFSLILFDFHRLSEATRRGARAAIIQPSVADLSGMTPTSTTIITCSGDATTGPSFTVSCSGGSTSSNANTIFATIMADMQGIKSDLMGDNVTISYAATGVSTGTSGLVTPMVTVSITGFQYTYYTLTLVDDLLALSGTSGDVLGGTTTMTFPDFATSRVGATQNAI